MKTITLGGKEYQIDIQRAKELGVLKENDNRVKSWEEFKRKYTNTTGYVYIEEIKHVQTTAIPLYIGDQLTQHEAKALAAFSKLLKLRRDWIGEWELDWTISGMKWAIYRRSNEVVCDWCDIVGHSLYFPTQQMAQEFLETFHDLIEEAKTLI